MKKILFLTIIIIIAISCDTETPKLPITEIASGYCGAQGDNLTWVLTSDGALTISGNGEMQNYTLNDDFVGSAPSTTAPWFSYQTEIKTVIVENGVINIGSWAFAFCSSLTSATIGDGVTTIGHRAFSDSYRLRSVSVGSSIAAFGQMAFSNCHSLTVVTSHALTPPTLSSTWMLQGVSMNSTVLRVPAESIKLYQEAHGWQNFRRIIAITAQQ